MKRPISTDPCIDILRNKKVFFLQFTIDNIQCFKPFDQVALLKSEATDLPNRQGRYGDWGCELFPVKPRYFSPVPLFDHPCIQGFG